MREFINKYGIIVSVVLIVFSALLIYFLWPSGPPTSTTKSAYYFDESTGKESIQPLTEVPPLLNSEGKATLVEEVKISCQNGKNPRVAFYKKYAPDQQKRLIEISQMPRAENAEMQRRRDMEKQQMEMTGLWIRKTDANSPWVLAASREGAQIQSETMSCPDNDVATRVFPP